MNWLWGPEPGVSQYHGRPGAARERRKLIRERAEWSRRTAGLAGRVESEPTEIEKQLTRSIERIRFSSTVKGLYLAVPIRGDGRDGSNFMITVRISPNKPTETIMSMQKNGFWGYSHTGRPTFILPGSIAGKVAVIDVER